MRNSTVINDRLKLIKNNTRKIPVLRSINVTDVSVLTSVTLILRGTGIFLLLFYIYPIVPYALALCAQFLLKLFKDKKQTQYIRLRITSL